MAAHKKQEQINLIPQKGLETSTTGRILLWVLSTFRMIVILTEIIVMVAFLSRFWLDARNSELNDEVKRKQAVLAASQDFENNFRLVQQKLKVYDDILATNSTPSFLAKSVAGVIPTDTILTSLNMSSGKLNIGGLSASEKSIQQFLLNLQSVTVLSNLNLINVSTSDLQPNLMTFTIQADVNNGGQKQ